MLNKPMLIKIRDLMYQIRDAHAQFRMDRYGGYWRPEGCISLSEARECGTSGCALGWATTCLEAKFEDEDYYEYYISLCFLEQPSDLEAAIVFDWLFAQTWFWVEGGDGPEHVAKRIDWLLENGLAGLKSQIDSDRWEQKLWQKVAACS